MRSHATRSAANSAAYLLPHLTAGMSLLDVGCGPGTITVDLAEAVAPGAVIGIDPVSSIVEEAQQLLTERGVTNCRFDTGDSYELDFGDDSFDVVHAHQVLQHLREPVAALREMLRVAKPGGIVAVRDADYAGMIWSPRDPMLDRWMQLYHEITALNQVEADAGRYLSSWVNELDVVDIEHSWSVWTYATPELTRWWGGVWTDRVLQSSYGEQALEHGLSTPGELESLSQAWSRWGQEPNAVFVIPHGEIVARKPHL